MKNIETQIVYAACPCLWPEICSVLPLCHTYYIYICISMGVEARIIHSALGGWVSITNKVPVTTLNRPSAQKAM